MATLDISPKFGIALGALVGTLGALGGAVSQLTTLFGDGDAKKIVAGASLMAILLGPTILVLGGGSSSQPGPWATPDSPEEKAAAAKVAADKAAKALADAQAAIPKVLAFLVMLLAASFALHGHVWAAETKTPHRGCGKGSIYVPCPAPVPIPVPGDGGDTISVLTKAASLSDAIIADLKSADSIAGAPNPGTGQPYDELGHLCFPAAETFIATLPSPSSLPTPTGPGGLVTTFEEGRIAALAAAQAIQNIATSGYPMSLKVACDPWLLDNVTQATNATIVITAFIARFIPK